MKRKLKLCQHNDIKDMIQGQLDVELEILEKKTRMI